VHHVSPRGPIATPWSNEEDGMKEASRFYEFKNRVQEFDVPHDWCIEIMRGNHFISPVQNAEIIGDRITMRVTPISGKKKIPLP